MTGRERTALTALTGILAVTAAWWAFALWPLPSSAPYWLVRSREVCFGALPDTLPTRAGWILLIGEPLAMLGAAVVLWWDAIPGAFSALARSIPGRVGLATAGLALFAGAALASGRVASASAREGVSGYVAPPPDTYPRLDRDAPAIGLVDQHGDTVTLAALRGRPVLVTFAYAHCMTACPTLVRETLSAQRALAADRPAVIVVTVDPWRDTPERLPTVAQEWQLEGDAHVVSGDTAAVLRVLEAWQVPHDRDLTTGDLAHPNVVYLVAPDGRVAYQVIGRADAIVTLARRL